MHMYSLRRWLLPATLLLLAGCTARTGIEADYVFENVNVVPMNEETVLAQHAVAVRDGKIVAIVDQSKSGSLIADRRIDGGGQYLMPGLADMHVHVRWAPQAMFNLFLANGITTVVNMRLNDGEGSIDHLALREAVAAGHMTGPRYLISGPQLHADQLQTIDAVGRGARSTRRAGVRCAQSAWRSEPGHLRCTHQGGARARGIRVTGHGQHLMPLSESLRMDSLEHIEEFLYMSRDPAFGRAAAGSLENFLRAYSSNLENLAEPDHRAAIVRDVVQAKIYVAPSLIIYKYIQVYLADDLFEALQDDPRVAYLPEAVRNEYLTSETNEYRRDLAVVFGKHLGPGVPVDEHFAHNVELLSALLLELQKAGVPLLLSTDLFGAAVPGFSAHQELELFVAAGLTPYQALRTGTINVAKYLGEAETAGTIEVGKRADFILVQQNPLSDVTHTASVKGVFTQGRWHSEEGVERLLVEAKQIVAGEGE